MSLLVTILLFLLSLFLTAFFYFLIENAIENGKYSMGPYHRKETIWDFPFYISAIITLVLLAILFGSFS